MGQACDGQIVNFDTLMQYVAVAHGLHEAAETARAAGDEQWARELHAQGQLFLHYATSDIEALAIACAQQILAQAMPHAGDAIH